MISRAMRRVLRYSELKDRILPTLDRDTNLASKGIVEFTLYKNKKKKTSRLFCNMLCKMDVFITFSDLPEWGSHNAFVLRFDWNVTWGDGEGDKAMMMIHFSYHLLGKATVCILGQTYLLLLVFCNYFIIGLCIF